MRQQLGYAERLVLGQTRCGARGALRLVLGVRAGLYPRMLTVADALA
jgi:hypothetical protein